MTATDTRDLGAERKHGVRHGRSDRHVDRKSMRVPSCDAAICPVAAVLTSSNSLGRTGHGADIGDPDHFDDFLDPHRARSRKLFRHGEAGWSWSFGASA